MARPSVSRRHFLKGAATALVGLALPKKLEAGGSRRKPNIVLILADDMGWPDEYLHSRKERS